MTTTGYNYTDNARDVLAAAREHASRLRHDAVTPEHVLLGVISVGEGVAAAALSRLGANLESLTKEVEARMEPAGNKAGGGDLPFSADTQRALELAVSEARELNHVYIGTEHLLLALISEGHSAAATILAGHRLTAERLRPEVLRLLNSDRQSTMTKRPG